MNDELRDIERSIEILKFLRGGKTENKISEEFGNREGQRISGYLWKEELVDEKNGKYYLNKRGRKNLRELLKEQKKIKKKEFWRHPITIVVITALLTALLTIPITYKIAMFGINEQKDLALVEQTHDRLKLYIDRVGKQEEDCKNATNKMELITNQQLLENATKTFLEKNISSTSYYLDQIERCISCSKCVIAKEVRKDYVKGPPLIVFMVILLILLIALLSMLRAKIKKRLKLYKNA